MSNLEVAVKCPHCGADALYDSGMIDNSIEDMDDVVACVKCEKKYIWEVEVRTYARKTGERTRQEF